MKTETKSCPKCGERFECNNQDIFKCVCVQVPLDNNVRQLISEKYDDCLCLTCLKEYALLDDPDRVVKDQK